MYKDLIQAPHFIRAIFDWNYIFIRRELNKFLNSTKEAKTIFDFGSGTDPYKDLIPPSMVKTNYDIQTTPEIKWQTDGKTYDIILLIEVLEHIEQPTELIIELLKKLNLNGKIIVTVPFSARVHGAPDDFCRWTPSGLLSMAHKAGADVQCIKPRGNAWLTVLVKLNYLAVCGLFSVITWPIAILGLIILVPLNFLCHVLAGLGWQGPNWDPLGYTMILKLRS